MHMLLAIAVHHQQAGRDHLIPYVVVLAVGLVLGRVWGRRAGLRHLGEAEFRTRWAAVRKVSQW
jgi:hypothetical protein